MASLNRLLNSIWFIAERIHPAIVTSFPVHGSFRATGCGPEALKAKLACRWTQIAVHRYESSLFAVQSTGTGKGSEGSLALPLK